MTDLEALEQETHNILNSICLSNKIENPVLLILADWYEEAGNLKRAKGLRYCCIHKKRPYCLSNGSYRWNNILDSILNRSCVLEYYNSLVNLPVNSDIRFTSINESLDYLGELIGQVNKQ